MVLRDDDDITALQFHGVGALDVNIFGSANAAAFTMFHSTKWQRVEQFVEPVVFPVVDVRVVTQVLTQRYTVSRASLASRSVGLVNAFRMIRRCFRFAATL